MSTGLTVAHKKQTSGLLQIEMPSWKELFPHITQRALKYPHYAWRGQRDASWRLESSLHRLLKGDPPSVMRQRASQHLERFKLAVRGRRGPNPPAMKSADEWWALGQHQGLATPLLDWTMSPFVALYFAFYEAMPSSCGRRAVFSIYANDSLNNPLPESLRDGKGIRIVRPLQDDNARLVSQSGLFTKVPLGESIDTWIEKYYPTSKHTMLIKITFPDADRVECLQTLNRMNISHLSLFPDMFGASVHSNRSLEIDEY